jgi:hypothetical protein
MIMDYFKNTRGSHLRRSFKVGKRACLDRTPKEGNAKASRRSPQGKLHSTCRAIAGSAIPPPEDSLLSCETCGHIQTKVLTASRYRYEADKRGRFSNIYQPLNRTKFDSKRDGMNYFMERSFCGVLVQRSQICSYTVRKRNVW